MTSVGSVDSWNADHGGGLPEPAPEPAPGPDESPIVIGTTPTADDLIGFLLDFRAAESEPDPPEPEATTAPSIPASRFAHAPGSHTPTIREHEPAGPLPVWPPLPGPAAHPASPPGPAPAVFTADPAPASPAVAVTAAAKPAAPSGDDRRGVSVFRRLGRRP